jgi:hypothetical protein
MDTLEPEAKRYDFFDKEGNLCNTKEQVLEESTYKVWDNMRDRENIKAVVVIEAVAEEICKLFEVKPKDRRAQLRRKTEVSS